MLQPSSELMHLKLYAPPEFKWDEVEEEVPGQLLLNPMPNQAANPLQMWQGIKGLPDGRGHITKDMHFRDTLLSKSLGLDHVDGEFVKIRGGHERRNYRTVRVRDLGEKDEGLDGLRERDAVGGDLPQASDDTAHLVLERTLVAHTSVGDEGFKETPDVRTVRFPKLCL